MAMSGGMWPQAGAAAARSEYCSFNSDSEDELEKYTPIIHPFGRGKFREMAEKAIIPDVVMKKLQNNSTWVGMRGVSVGLQLPCAVTRSRGRGRAQILQQNSISSIRPGIQHQDHHPAVACPPVIDHPPARQCPPVMKPSGYSEEDSSDLYVNEFSSSDSSSCAPRDSTHFRGKGRGFTQNTTYTPQHNSYASVTKKKQRPKPYKLSPTSFCYRPTTNEDFYSSKPK